MQEVELTYFERLREEGVVQGKRETLKRQLARKLGPLPADVETYVVELTSAEQLDGYLERVTASSFEEMGSRVDFLLHSRELECLAPFFTAVE